MTKECDINIRDKNGKTPLKFALFWKELTIAKRLITKGAKIDLKDMKQLRLINSEVYHEIVKDSPISFDEFDNDNYSTISSDGSDSSAEINGEAESQDAITAIVTGDISKNIYDYIEG